jgi:1A family penicillin-binding protein
MKVYNFESSPIAQTKFGRKAQRWLKNLPWKKIGTWSFRIGAAGVLLIAFLFIYYSRSLPDPNRLLGRNVPESTKIYAKDGSLLYEVHGEVKRTLVNLDDMPDDLKNATIAVEDKNFYKHAGISVTGLARSVFVDILHGEKRQGGSTITQQFVKNAVLTRDKSYLRKVKEIILSIEIEARFSKDEILKLYLNEIPYGRNAYGVEAASQTYFGKSAKDLTLAESAYLAALPQAPSYYNPSGAHFDALEGRQKYILSTMKDLGYINEDRYQEALNEKVAFSQITNSIKAPHFVQYVQDYLADKYGERTLEEGGLKVYTTLDPHLQEIAEKAVAEGAVKNEKYNAYNAALVAMDPKTGQILAMVGSKDYFGANYPEGCNPQTCLFSPNVNVATTLQQPGSSFKPYAYVTAFGRDFNYAPASMLIDVVTDFGNYTPRNFNLAQNGPLSMRKALAGSLNVPAVKTLALIGPDRVVQTARDLGHTSPMQDCGLSLVLGGCDVKLIDHTAGFGVFATGGVRHEKTAILKVVGQDGKTLEEYEDHSEEVLDPQAVYLLTSILTDNAARSYIFGANSPLILPGRPVAAKTGTTNEFRDGWTMGFTPSLVAGVWTGNNNNAPMKRDSISIAAPIWNQFMKEALKDTPVEQFARPEGIQDVTVDALSGKLPTQYTPETKTEVFASYNVPTERDNVHVPVQIDLSTGLPATQFTSPDQISTEIYTVLHSEKPDNPNWENPVIAWALANGYKYPPGSGIEPPPNTNGPTIDFTQPNDNAIISQLPFLASVSTTAQNIAKIDISIDGELLQTLTSAPFSTSINKKYSDGVHTLSAKATDTNGATSTTSVQIRYAIDSPLVMAEPSNGSTVNLPLKLAAESPVQYSSVTFYYQIGATTKAIASGDATVADQGLYEYSITWDNAPKPGDYKLYARSNTGQTSNKISITIK